MGHHTLSLIMASRITPHLSLIDEVTPLFLTPYTDLFMHDWHGTDKARTVSSMEGDKKHL